MQWGIEKDFGGLIYIPALETNTFEKETNTSKIIGISLVDIDTDLSKEEANTILKNAKEKYIGKDYSEWVK